MPVNIQNRGAACHGTRRNDIAAKSAAMTKYRSMRNRKNSQMRQLFCFSMSMKVKGMVI